ncbi:MAG: class I SAM-dependent methyltransferase [Desulfobacterales bacterium]|nr:MAG: class I SAM-dependent methyltransferase [Desulfobacterales bacterium]
MINHGSSNIRISRNRNVRCVEGQRLVYYRSRPDAAYWDAHWKQNYIEEIYEKAEQGHLGRFEKLFTGYLPKYGRILEAGCGLGQHVLALRKRGFEIEGIDWAAETVKTALRKFPDLPIYKGDVTNIEVPSDYYTGYISLGVAEHLFEGPESLLREAYRVLKPEGVALISIPYFHILRRLKARLRLYQTNTDGIEFYQYAFRNEEFTSLLLSSGFKIIDRMVYSIPKGVKDEIPGFSLVIKLRGIGWRLQRVLRSWAWARSNLGHMILFICKKPR